MLSIATRGVDTLCTKDFISLFPRTGNGASRKCHSTVADSFKTSGEKYCGDVV